MKDVKVLLLCLYLVLPVTVVSQTKEWRGIVPLHSTRADVERLLGKPNFDGTYYDFENERASIIYSREPCTEGDWNVPRDTVLQISIAPKIKLKFADLRLDLSKYERIEDPHVQVRAIYWNEENGVQYDVFEGGGENNGMVLEIYHKPAAETLRLRCPVPISKKPCASSGKTNYYR